MKLLNFWLLAVKLVELPPYSSITTVLLACTRPNFDTEMLTTIFHFYAIKKVVMKTACGYRSHLVCREIAVEGNGARSMPVFLHYRIKLLSNVSYFLVKKKNRVIFEVEMPRCKKKPYSHF